MTHIPRIRPPLLGLLLMIASAIAVMAILVSTAVSLIRNPPVPPPQVSYLGHDQANPWGGK